MSGILLLGVGARVLGLLREMVLAHEFGTGAALDAVWLAMAVPMAITVAAGGGFARATVAVGAALSEPQFGDLRTRGTRRILRVGGVIALAMALGSVLWGWALVAAAPELPWSTLLQGAAIASLALPGGVLTGFWMGLSNARGRHFLPSANPILYNVVIIGFLLLGGRTWGALSLVLGTVVAEWAQLALLWISVRSNKRKTAIHRAGDGSWNAVLKGFWPASLLGFTAGLNVVVDRFFAGNLGEGAISTLSYADRLLNLPVGLVGMALTTPLYTRFALFHGSGDRVSFDRSLTLGIRLALFGAVPLALGLAVLAEPMISVLFARGAFTTEDTVRCASAFRGYGAAIIFLTVQHLLMAALFARGRHWAVVTTGLAGVLMNAIGNGILAPRFGVFGIALSTSISSGACIVLFLAQLLPGPRFRRPLLRTALLGGVIYGGGLTLWALARPLPPWQGTLLVLVIGGGVILGTAPLLLQEWRSIRRQAGASAQDAQGANAEGRGSP